MKVILDKADFSSVGFNTGLFVEAFSDRNGGKTPVIGNLTSGKILQVNVKRVINTSGVAQKVMPIHGYVNDTLTRLGAIKSEFDYGTFFFSIDANYTDAYILLGDDKSYAAFEVKVIDAIPSTYSLAYAVNKLGTNDGTYDSFIPASIGKYRMIFPVKDAKDFKVQVKNGSSYPIVANMGGIPNDILEFELTQNYGNPGIIIRNQYMDYFDEFVLQKYE